MFAVDRSGGRKLRLSIIGRMDRAEGKADASSLLGIVHVHLLQ